MPKETAKKPSTDIFTLLSEASKKKRKEKRAQILQSMNVKEIFEEGTISIDKKTCQGVECKLCIKACPTNALYWKNGEVGIEEELCVFCAACVTNCIVDNCIRVSRKRPNGKIERFNTPSDVLILLNNINSERRIDAVKLLFTDSKAYLKRYSKSTASKG
jgi:ferredoxin